MELNLRPYQQECVDRILNAYQTNPHSTELVVAPCAWGKTVMFAEVIHQLSKKYGLNALVIAHTDALLDQAADKYRMIKPDAVIGKVGSGLHQYGGEVTVASIATISRPEHIKRLKTIGYGLIITDEGHHSQAESYQKVYEALPDAFHLMVTATSDRLDGKPLIDKPPLYTANIIDMIQQGYLCNVKTIAIQTHISLDDLHNRAGDYAQDELELAVDTPARNKLITEKYLEHTPGKRAVAFCVTVAHAVHLAQAFNEAGIPAALIAGETLLHERDRIYKAFRAGNIKVITNVMVLSEGWDEPLCEVGIAARPTQSRALFVQQFGRILRLAPGKPFATWIDITENCLKHRLEPLSLRKVLGKELKPEESLLEALAREQEEIGKKSSLPVTRKLKEQRNKDIEINLLARLDWVLNGSTGIFVLEVGPEKHRIALAPSDNYDTLYTVWARLAPFYEPQVWYENAPLDWCQSFAEKKARLLLADPENIKLVDRNRPWRSHPPTEVQLEKIEKYVKKGYITASIPVDEEGNYQLTKGEASDLLEPVFAMFARWDEQRAARQQRVG